MVIKRDLESFARCGQDLRKRGEDGEERVEGKGEEKRGEDEFETKQDGKENQDDEDVQSSYKVPFMF